MPTPPFDQTIRTPAPLFTVRVWQEDLGDGGVEWRGKIQDVVSGESRYFRDWYELVRPQVATFSERAQHVAT